MDLALSTIHSQFKLLRRWRTGDPLEHVDWFEVLKEGDDDLRSRNFMEMVSKVKLLCQSTPQKTTL